MVNLGKSLLYANLRTHLKFLRVFCEEKNSILR